MERRDFHTFGKDGRHYVFLTDLVSLFEIDADTSAVLARVEAGETPFGEGVRQRWQQFCDHMDELARSMPKAKALRSPEDIPDHVIGLYLFVSQQCNLRCTYCYADEGEYGQPGKMNKEVVRQTFDRFFSEGQRHQVTFFGGEPLMNLPVVNKTIELADEYRKAGKADIAFNVVTNGTIYSKKIETLFRDHISDVTFSLDGPKALQDEQRPSKSGWSSHDKISKNIERLTADTQVNWGIRSIVTSQGCDQVEEIYRHLNEFGPGGIGLVDADVPTDHPLYMDDEAYERFVEQIVAVNRKGLRSFVEGGQPVAFEYPFYILFHFVSRTHNLYHCNAGTNLLAVTAEGDVYPCHRFVGIDEFRMGNVADPALRESAPFQDIRKRFMHTTVDERSGCCDCWARYLCGGSCDKYSYTEHGDMEPPVERHCHYIKTVIEVLLPDVAAVIEQPAERLELMQRLRAGLSCRIGAKGGEEVHVA
ncbi:MAG: SPASM domain-containing protein [Thiohalomonadaceae bacterium]